MTEGGPLVVGVVGAGTMGAGIAQVCLGAGHEVVLYDVDEAAVERGRGRIADGLERLVSKGRLGAEARDLALLRLRTSESLDAIGAEADLVIEAALEDLDLKRTIFRALDSSAGPDVPLATNTSALSVGAIAEAVRRPERVLGLHFFNPAPVMPLVEVVVSDATSRAVLERALAFIAELGKTPVACRDAPGFIVNRVNRPFTLEALRILDAGEAGVADVDRVIEAAGFPMGPFRLMDLVGIDVNHAVARALFEAFDGAERFEPSPTQARLVEAGNLGRKTGCGFYRYDVEPPIVAEEFDSAPSRPLREDEIGERIELAIINEAYHAIGEGVAEPSDIDRALKLGARYPLGPFERAGELGLRHVVDGLVRLEERYGERFRVAPALWQLAHV